MTHLTLSFAQERAKYGKRASSVPSRFLFEAQGAALPADWVGVEAQDGEDEPGARRGKKKAARGRATAAGEKPRKPRARRR